jgi:hypothetical protein
MEPSEELEEQSGAAVEENLATMDDSDDNNENEGECVLVAEAEAGETSSFVGGTAATLAGGKGGKKLPYFHRVLTPEDRSLIGDITPKRLDETVAAPTTAVDTSASAQGSAWNAAKIWEEKDHTPWAKQTVQSLFSSADLIFTYNDLEITVSEVEDVKGHANVTYSRGKPRYMYSVSFTLTADVDVKGGDSYTAKVTVDDVMNDVLEDIELSCTWEPRPSNAKLKDCNTAVTGKPMREFVIRKMREFEAEYQKKV